MTGDEVEIETVMLRESVKWLCVAIDNDLEGQYNDKWYADIIAKVTRLREHFAEQRKDANEASSSS